MKKTHIELDSQIAKVILPGENLVWYGKPKISCYVLEAVIKILPIALLWVILDGSFISIMVITDIFSQVPTMAFIYIPFFLIHFAPVWLWLGGVCKAVNEFKRVMYALTDERLIIKSGLTDFDVRTVLLKDIKETSLTFGRLDKKLKTGDIHVSGEFFKLDIADILNSEEVFKLLQTNIKLAGDGDREQI